MRRFLYVKDDDYRLSFDRQLCTLTNLREGELERNARPAFKPPLCFVHTTNPVLRCRMLGNKRAAKLTILKKLVLPVLCMPGGALPGINDGQCWTGQFPSFWTSTLPSNTSGGACGTDGTPQPAPLNGASPRIWRILEQVESWQKRPG